MTERPPKVSKGEFKQLSPTDPVELFAYNKIKLTAPANLNEAPAIIENAVIPLADKLQAQLNELESDGINSQLLAEAKEILADYQRAERNLINHQSWEADDRVLARQQEKFKSSYDRRLQAVVKIITELKALPINNPSAVTKTIRQPNPLVFGMNLPAAGAAGKFGAQTFHQGLIVLRDTNRLPTSPTVQTAITEMLKLTNSVGQEGLTEETVKKLRALILEVNIPESIIRPKPEISSVQSEVIPEQLYQSLNARLEAWRINITKSEKLNPNLPERVKRLAKTLADVLVMPVADSNSVQSEAEIDDLVSPVSLSAEANGLITQEAVAIHQANYSGGIEKWEEDFETFIRAIFPKVEMGIFSSWFSRSESENNLYEQIIQAKMTVADFTELSRDLTRQKLYLNAQHIKTQQFDKFKANFEQIIATNTVSINPQLTVLDVLKEAFVANCTSKK